MSFEERVEAVRKVINGLLDVAVERRNKLVEYYLIEGDINYRGPITEKQIKQIAFDKAHRETFNYVFNTIGELNSKNGITKIDVHL